MALVDIVRSAVATVNRVTESMHGDVRHAAWRGQDIAGRPIYGRRESGIDVYGFDPVAPLVSDPRSAIIEVKQSIREVGGRVVITHAHLIFLSPFAPDAMPAFPDPRVNPVDPRDWFVLPDGRSAPVVDVAGFIDSTTSAPFFVEVWLGGLSERGTGALIV